MQYGRNIDTLHLYFPLKIAAFELCRHNFLRRNLSLKESKIV